VSVIIQLFSPQCNGFLPITTGLINNCYYLFSPLSTGKNCRSRMRQKIPPPVTRFFPRRYAEGLIRRRRGGLRQSGRESGSMFPSGDIRVWSIPCRFCFGEDKRCNLETGVFCRIRGRHRVRSIPYHSYYQFVTTVSARVLPFNDSMRFEKGFPMPLSPVPEALRSAPLLQKPTRELFS
jgi:hypothetical protein